MDFKWFVKLYDCNANIIKDYDIAKSEADIIKKLKKKCSCKAEFAKELRSHLIWQYWSRCEYELIIKADGERITLEPWVGCRNPEEVKIDVTSDNSFDWHGFAEKHINIQAHRNEAKIDVFDQVDYKFAEFIDFCWHHRFKYERDNPKYHE